MPPKCDRSGATLSAKPCSVTQRCTRTPIAAILSSQASPLSDRCTATQLGPKGRWASRRHSHRCGYLGQQYLGHGYLAHYSWLKIAQLVPAMRLPRGGSIRPNDPGGRDPYNLSALDQCAALSGDSLAVTSAACARGGSPGAPTPHAVVAELVDALA